MCTRLKNLSVWKLLNIFLDQCFCFKTVYFESSFYVPNNVLKVFNKVISRPNYWTAHTYNPCRYENVALIAHYRVLAMLYSLIFLSRSKRHTEINAHINLSRPTASLQEETDVCVRQLFCAKFNSEQLLFEAFCDVMRIFSSIQPKVNVNVICYFSTT